MEDYVFRVDLLGNPGVGKLAMVERLERGMFFGDKRPITRLGTDIHTRVFALDEVTVRLQLWPNHYATKHSYPPGQFLRRSSFFSHGLILVYDIADYKSLYDLEGWIEHCRDKVEELDMQMVLAGCKADLQEKRSVSKEDAVMFAKKVDLFSDLQIEDVIECSAKTGENVEEVFLVLISRMLNRFKD